MQPNSPAEAPRARVSLLSSPWRRGMVVVCALALIGSLALLVSASGERKLSEQERVQKEEEASKLAQKIAPSRENPAREEAGIPKETSPFVSAQASSPKVFSAKTSTPQSAPTASGFPPSQGQASGDFKSNSQSRLKEAGTETSGVIGRQERPQEELENVKSAGINDDEFLRELEAESDEAQRDSTIVEGLGESTHIPLPEKRESEETARSGVLPVLDPEGRAEITGEVYGPSGEGLPGVLVSIPQIDQTTRADQDGKFSFSDLPAGELTLKFNKLGYEPVAQTVVLKREQVLKVTQAMEEKPTEFDDGEYELDEVEIVGEFLEEEEALDDIVIDLADFKQGGITSGVSAEDFEKSDASDAADAVATIAGANIVDGKFAVVRGLADRYVSTTYNGGAIASSVPNRKAVELDLFPTSALSGINVDKTYNSSLSGDFGGAAIDIRTKSFPAENFLNLKTEFSYRADLPSDFLSVAGGDLDFLGDVELSFDLRESLGDDGRFIGSGSDPATQPLAQAVGRELFINSRSLFPENEDREQPRSFGFGLGRNFNPSEQFEWGFLFNLNQKSANNFNETERIRPVDVLAPQEDFQRRFTRSREWDLYLAAGFKAFEQHEVGASFFRKHTATFDVSEVTDIRSPQDSEGFGLVLGVQEQDGQLQRIRDNFGAFAELTGSSLSQQSIERDLEILQTYGQHQFGTRGPKVDWSYTDSDAREFRENSFFSFGMLDFGSEALLEEINQVAFTEIEGVIENLQNPELFVGVTVPEFTSAGEAVAGLSSIIDNLTVDNLSPDANFPPQLSPQRIIDLLRANNQRDLDNATEFLSGLDPERDEELTISIRTLSVEPGQGLPIIRGLQVVEEKVENFRGDVTLPFYFSDDDESRGFELLLGASQVSAERTTTGLAAQLLLETTDGSLTLTPGSLTTEQLTSLSDALEQNGQEGFNEALSELITGGSLQAAQILDASTGPLDTIFADRIASNSTTTRDIKSHYFGGRLFWDDFFIRGGVRFESETREGQILDPQPETGIEFPGFESTEILPSLSFGSSFFNDRVSVLGSWSQTVARPTFFEFVPIVSQDFSSNTIRQGNADLNNTDISNFDLSAALRFGESSLFRASLFHKILDEPIVARRQPEFPSAITFVNGDSGVISGLELELNFLEFQPWSLNANLTFIDASLEFDGGLGSGLGVETQFPFQPKFIANLNLGYESLENNWAVNLVFNYTGTQNTLLPATVESPTQEQQPLLSLDLIARKTFDWDGVGEFKLSAGIKNLIANDREEIFVGGSDNAASLRGLTAISEQRLRTFFIGGELSF